MPFLQKIVSGLRALFRKHQVEQDMDDELGAYVDAAAAEKRATGLSREASVRAARLEAGSLERVKENIRASGWESAVESFWQDVRFGLRMLRRNPGFTAVAVLTLSLGIGVNTAMFSIFDAFLFRSLAVKDPAQLVYLVSLQKGGGESNGFSYPDSEDIRRQTNSVFSDISPIEFLQSDGLSFDGKNEPISTNYVAGNFFGMLGIQPALGRLILPSEGKVAGANPVLVLGYSFWKEHFGGDLHIVGKEVAIDSHPVTIVGVAPEGFHGLASWIDAQGYLPLGMAAVKTAVPDKFLGDRTARSFALIGRLKSGVSLQQAQVSLDVVAHGLSQQYPDTDAWETVKARVLGSMGPSTGTNPLPVIAALFLILAGFVLLLACVNIANLLLARGATRQREIAMRAALGAARGRLIRQLLTETTLLGLLGGLLGIVLGVLSSRGLDSIHIPFVLGLPVVLDFGINWRVFVYALAAALATGLLVGLAPALRASGNRVGDLLHEGGRTASGGHRRRTHNLLVEAQVGGSFVLLIVAGLFARSLARVQDANLGFDPDHVLNLSMDPHQAGYDDAQGQEFLRGLLERVRLLPGVESASLAASVPMGGIHLGSELQIEGYEPPPGRPPFSFAGENMVSSGYFSTMHIPLLSGRDILDSDSRNPQRVAVINEAMAAAFWTGQNPIGKRFAAKNPSHPLEFEVVGVVKNSRVTSLSMPIGPYFYTQLAQDSSSSGLMNLPTTLQIRTTGMPATMAHGILELIHSLSPTMPVSDVQTMSQALDTLNGVLLFRIGAALAGALGILGLLLAVIGIYGVVSHATNQRTHEIGVRMALGAKRAQILTMILRQACVVVGIGLTAGIVAAMAMAHLVGNFLVGVGPIDPLTYVGVSILLTLVGLAACYIPARRAMKVDPVIALRYE